MKETIEAMFTILPFLKIEWLVNSHHTYRDDKLPQLTLPSQVLASTFAARPLFGVTRSPGR